MMLAMLPSLAKSERPTSNASIDLKPSKRQRKTTSKQNQHWNLQRWWCWARCLPWRRPPSDSQSPRCQPRPAAWSACTSPPCQPRQLFTYFNRVYMKWWTSNCWYFTNSDHHYIPLYQEKTHQSVTYWLLFCIHDTFWQSKFLPFFSFLFILMQHSDRMCVACLNVVCVCVVTRQGREMAVC